MTRPARRLGEYLHVIVRGIGKQILFEDDADRKHFLSLLEKYRNDSEVQILAYCLMENHVHLLIHDASGNISLFMKKVGVGYSGYYNKKYDRTGHLFQDRYKSEIISDDRGLLAVYRYILNNPANAGVARANRYAWSSYHEYGKTDGLTDNRLLCAMIGGTNEFRKFMAAADEGEFMEDRPAKHDDVWAMGIIRRVLNASSGTVLQKMPKAERDEAIAKLKNAGMTVRQLERLTGLNRGIIQKAKSVKQNRPR